MNSPPHGAQELDPIDWSMIIFALGFTAATLEGRQDNASKAWAHDCWKVAGKLCAHPPPEPEEGRPGV